LLVADPSAARLLRDAGYQVASAGEPAEILARARDEEPELVILGCEADPGATPETCQALKQGGGALLPVLLVTSGSVAAGFRAGVDDVLRRPLDRDELCARVEVWRRTRRLTSPAAAPPALAAPVGRDGVTGLPDANAFSVRLENAFRHARREHAPLSVMAVELDCAVGDKLLVACARAAARTCRDTDFLARATGAELIALLVDVHFAGSVKLAERLWGELSATTVDEGGARLSCAASVGVASYPARDIKKSMDLLRYAQAALARAKSEGPGRICLYHHQGYLLQPTPA
jgi:diguanylate cyclase (GGDEF)-like protein